MSVMKEKDILRLYSSWAGIPIQDKLSGIPIGNLDVFEDDRRLDNLFVKSINGELTLLKSSLHLLRPYD